MYKILITGANSYIGTSFANYMKRYSDEVTIDTIDMKDSNWRDNPFNNYDVVFHVAGIAHSDNGKISKEKEKLYRSINTNLTIETAKKAKQEGVKQFIFMSSAIVYGNSAPIGKQKIITKETKPSPANCYGDSKLQAENGLKELESEDFKIVILRPPIIYGKNSKGNYPQLRKFIKFPLIPYIKNSRSMLYIENLCEFIRLMIINEENGIFLLQNNEYVNTTELIKIIGEVNGRKVYLIKGFTWAVKLLGLFTGLANKAFGNFIYDFDSTKYKEDYAKVDLFESIKRTEI